MRKIAGKFPLVEVLALAIAALLAMQSGYCLDSPTPEQLRSMSREERAAFNKKQREERAAAHLKKCQEDFDQAKSTKPIEPDKYFQALVNLAYAYKGVEKKEEANKLFAQAVAFYKENPESIKSVCRRSGIWPYVGESLRTEQPDAQFFDLITIVEKHPPDNIHDLNEVIEDSLRHMSMRRDASGQKALWSRFLAIRESARGKDYPGLSFLLQRYATACEALKEIDEAERTYLRMYALDQREDPSSKAGIQIKMAGFYLRHSLFDKADAAWHKAEQLVHSGMDEHTAGSFARLATEYSRAGRDADMNSIITTLLKDGGDPIVKALDPTITDLVNGYIASFAYVKAEDLLKKRIEASATCSNDTVSGDWRIRLSDVLLANGHRAESDKIFNEVVASIVLQRRSPDYLREKRAQLLANLGHFTDSAAMQKSAPVRSTGPIILQYALFANRELKLGHNCTISCYDSNSPRNAIAPIPDFGCNDAGVCCLGEVTRDGNLMMRGSITAAEVSDSVRRGMRPDQIKTVTALSKLSYADAPKPPANCRTFAADDNRGTSGLEPGDYIIHSLAGLQFSNTPGVRRLFLEDSSSGPLKIDGRYYLGLRQHKPIDCQIFYRGYRTLQVGGLTAVVYAPNATVELAFNGRFNGAIVADRIITAGNNNINFDRNLLGVELK